jgi:hypothetical protein
MVKVLIKWFKKMGNIIILVQYLKWPIKFTKI